MTADARSPLWLMIAALTLTPVLALAGCGEDDGSSDSTSPTNVSSTSADAETGAESQANEGGGSGGERQRESSGPGAGGGEEASAAAGSEQERLPRAPFPASADSVIEAVLAGPPTGFAPWPPDAVCERLMTPAFVRRSYGALEGCVAAQRPAALARSLEITRVRESGEAASATAVPTGGPYNGVEVEVELVRDGEGWRVDSLLADVPAGP